MTSAVVEPQAPTYSHKQILEALTGLLIAMFVAMLSSTVVTNALPTIVGKLHGSQTQYTWVVVASLLTMTVTTPIWGKFADQFSKKLLIQLALGIFIVGTIACGLAPSINTLIAARTITGVGVGGVVALVQIVIGSMVPPRERGRYSGYIGAAFGLATVSGPLVGGVIVDSPIGWRGCFFALVPFAIAAFFVLQATIKLPTVRREVKIDYLGATLLVAGVSLVLVWVSLAGQQFAWASTTTALLVAGALVLLAAAVYVEATVASEPVIPMWLFKDRTVALATLAAVFVGVAMFGASVYTSEYFQNARGMTPTHAGLMSLPLVGGLIVSSITSGRIISATGKWKNWLVSGMVLVLVGSSLLSTIDHRTPLVIVGLYMTVLGLGLGATLQNLVLAVQNNVAQSSVGAGSAMVAFFRSLGGSVGVSVLGSVLATQVATNTPSAGLQAAYGDATGHLFLLTAPFALVALICVLFIKESRLRTSLADLTEPEIDMVVATELEHGAARLDEMLVSDAAAGEATRS
jgi:EmrB/QacA subfamily drug resistance transporter